MSRSASARLNAKRQRIRDVRHEGEPWSPERDARETELTKAWEEFKPVWDAAGPKQRTAMFVYFIRSGPGGPVKIGLAANVDRRLRKMQIDNPEPLLLLGAWPHTHFTPDDPFSSAREVEHTLHKRFADLRLTGEWFAPDRLLLDFIAEQCVVVVV